MPEDKAKARVVKIAGEVARMADAVCTHRSNSGKRLTLFDYLSGILLPAVTADYERMLQDYRKEAEARESRKPKGGKGV